MRALEMLWATIWFGVHAGCSAARRFFAMPTIVINTRVASSTFPLHVGGCRVTLSPPRAPCGGVEWVTVRPRSEEHTSELQSLMRISYAVFCLKKKTNQNDYNVT